MSISEDIHEPLGQPWEPDDDLSRSAFMLLRQYARRGHYDPTTLETLRCAGGDPASLFAHGLILEAKATGQLHQTLLRYQPDIWWLDQVANLDVTGPLSRCLDAPALTRLRSDSLRLVATLDQDVRPPAWQTPADMFLAMVDDDIDPGSLLTRSRILARGLATAVRMSPEWLAPALSLIQARPSLALLSALARDSRLLDDDRWLCTLLLRGNSCSVALAAASLYFAPEKTLVRVRDFLAVAPASAMVRLAEVHGLLTLTEEEGADAAEALRTAFLTQLWRGTDLSGIAWWRAFRGEQLVHRSLPEVGSAAEVLARDVAIGLAKHLDTDACQDPGRQSAIAGSLAWLLLRDPDYRAALRLSEGRLRDMAQRKGPAAMTRSLRAYVSTLTSVIEELARTAPGRHTAVAVHARLVRLRKSYPDALTREQVPDDITQLTGEDRPAPSMRLARSLPDAAQELVATAEAVSALPTPVASWLGAEGWSPGRVLSWLVPTPLRHLATSVLRMLGTGPRARLILSDHSVGTLVRETRLLGLTIKTSRHGIPGGVIFTAPEGCEPADQLLGRWTAGLLLSGTLGPWLMLSGSAMEPLLGRIIGSALLVFGLAGYLGALGLHRAVAGGEAVAVRDEADQVSVWRVDEATRFMLSRLEPTEHDTAS